MQQKKNVQGVMVDGKEIELELFAEDLTAFLLNDNSVLKFFDLLKKFWRVFWS